jgi:hypothetical protein
MTKLTSFWFSFPEDPEFPRGFGVTARSQSDAEALLESQGYDFHRRARLVHVQADATPFNVDPKHVAPNSGPHVVRGIWYPALNIGFGALGGRHV